MRRWLLLGLAAPVVVAGLLLQQDVLIDSTSQDGFATLSQADQGSTIIGTSATQADITVSAASILIEDDILDITSTDDSWQVHAEFISHTGFTGLLTTFTLRLDDGTTSRTQIIIADGAATQTEGLAVDLPTTGDTEVRAVTTVGASGTLELELVLTPDAGGPTLRYPVSVTV